jgi:D-arabinose 1-dehydrogenase-like Zn-dependent alcohol dehydrogenase
MKAVVLRECKKPLAVEELGQPQPGTDEVLIRAEACGVCHSDVHVADGDWAQFAKIVKTPLIPGHEIAGFVVEKGAAVEDLQIGDRVEHLGFTEPAASASQRGGLILGYGGVNARQIHDGIHKLRISMRRCTHSTSV